MLQASKLASWLPGIAQKSAGASVWQPPSDDPQAYAGKRSHSRKGIQHERHQDCQVAWLPACVDADSPFAETLAAKPAALALALAVHSHERWKVLHVRLPASVAAPEAGRLDEVAAFVGVQGGVGRDAAGGVHLSMLLQGQPTSRHQAALLSQACSCICATCPRGTLGRLPDTFLLRVVQALYDRLKDIATNLPISVPSDDGATGTLGAPCCMHWARQASGHAHLQLWSRMVAWVGSGMALHLRGLAVACYEQGSLMCHLWNLMVLLMDSRRASK